VTEADDLDLRAPTVADGPVLWRIAAEAAGLDLNSPYAYLLWCRDFAGTSVIAAVDGSPAGFIKGYRRPEAPGTVVVWQIAVDAAHRGGGVAGRMLDHLVRRLQPAGVTHLEATVTPDNVSSRRLFAAFARRWEASLHSRELFGTNLFPDGHEAEQLFRIGPLRVQSRG
jgi:L-2,4-diaminobutyric acid acetyltransferase